ncbi:hypothetical protein KSF_106490 [Reticulibacter mediterranei]|uniref:Uncharacterized protein n=1 Tax=Reticulibacter mediterranei TaxID=2778369 RepID=A0A8J3ITQ3_9CHLR|nr:hypothetical protein KSF_106490 [Reticulibacter mediterranei]
MSTLTLQIKHCGDFTGSEAVYVPVPHSIPQSLFLVYRTLWKCIGWKWANAFAVCCCSELAITDRSPEDTLGHVPLPEVI